MFTDLSSHESSKSSGQSRLLFAAGDLVRPRTDQATLCEVLGAEDDDRIRVRGLDWSPGFSAILPATEIYLVSRGGADLL
jgi:hypothetical protein